MKKKIRDITAALAGILLHISGSVGKAKKKIEREYILPLYFHNPEKKLFHNVIKWLKDNDFSLISTRELIDVIKRRETPQKRTAWITFDDGWRRNLENVIPTVVEYDVPVTFFISTYPVENSGFFWWSVINRYKKELVLRYGIKRPEIWRLSWPEIKNIVNELETNGSKMQREAMTVREVIEISKLPQVTIGSHTVHHPIVKHCSETELISEILDSKLTLEK
jgi:peptidoglycan/xylan/chitin deacetylase (PgdA/CDA1 family)